MGYIGAIGPFLSTAASLIFLLIGAVCLYTMMARMGKKGILNPELYTKVHRIAGWSFTSFFVVLFIYMIIRVTHFTDEFASRITLHLALAIGILCLLAIKISVPRFFPNLGRNLFLLGICVYVLAFPMVLITAGYHLEKIIFNEPYVYHGDFDKNFADERLGKEFLIMKCSACHVLETILKPRSEEAWGKVMNRMVLLSQPRISEGEASQILAYVTKNYVPKRIEVPASASPIEQHCLPCHQLEDIYKTPYNLVAWKVILKKMNEHDEKVVPLDKIDDIADYLMKTQTK